MTENTIVLLACLAVIALMSILIYVASCGRIATALALSEIRRTLDQILAGSRAIEHTLAEQRGAINDIHHYLLPVSKGSEKVAR